MSHTYARRLALLVTAVVLLVGASPASAHADLVASSAAPCALVDGGETVVLEFSEELAPGSTISIEADGETVAVGGLDLDDLDRLRMRVVVPDRPADQLDVVWDALSAIDDDRTAGVVPLVGVAGGETACDPDPATSGGSLGLPLIAGATVALAAGFVGVARRSPERV